jgi:NADH-quinone oxidoreductase subunit J
MEILFFLFVAFVAVGSGVFVVTCKNPVNSAIALVNTFFCLATCYVMLDAPFMAAMQLIVYAGAIMVLIIFVIMLLNIGTVDVAKTSHAVGGGALMAVLVSIQVLYMLNRGEVANIDGPMTESALREFGHTELLARSLFTDFLLPFEVTSILLLVAIVGAVVLAKRDV